MSSAAEPRRRTARDAEMNAPNSPSISSASSCTVYGKPVTSSESTSRSFVDTVRRSPFSQAPRPRSAVNSSSRVGSYTAATVTVAVDLERERRAEDRQPVREVRRAVDRIEDPAVPRGRPRGARRAELLAEHVVIGIPLGHQLAEHALDGEIDLGDEIDRALLPHGEAAAERLELHAAGAPHGLDGGGEEGRGFRALLLG